MNATAVVIFEVTLADPAADEDTFMEWWAEAEALLLFGVITRGDAACGAAHANGVPRSRWSAVPALTQPTNTCDAVNATGARACSRGRPRHCLPGARL